MRVHGLAIRLLFAALSVTAGARAETASAAATPAPATATVLPLRLELGGSKLDAESVRRAIERELQHAVRIGAAPSEGESLSVVVHPDHSATVTYRASNGVLRSRSIGIPQDSSAAAEVIALLAGNLSRDEAAELLADLLAKTAPPARSETEASAEAGASAEAVTESKELAKPDIGAKAPKTERAPPTSPKREPTSNLPPLLGTPFPAVNLSLAPPLTLYRSSERRIFSGEFGIGYSHVGELHGAGLNLLLLRTERDVQGISFGTLYNDTGGTITGAAGSALINRRQRLRGVAFSGVLNLGSSDARGVSVAGLTNLEQDFEGIQTAGMLNWAGTFQGLQAAGALNRAGAFTGLQAAGAVNIADSMTGLQLGVVNVAGDVHGAQVGVVNVAKHVDGTSIGLVSVADNGRVQPVLWASSSRPLNGAMKFTVGPLYTQVGLGYAPGNQTYAWELGLGAHLALGRFFLEPGVHYSEVRSAKHPSDHELLEYGHYRLAVGADLGRVSPFLGVAVLHRFAHSVDAPASDLATVEAFGGAAFF